MTSQFQDHLFPLDERSENFDSGGDQCLLAVQVDQRSWMRFLAEDWLLPEQDGWLKLGYGCVSSNCSASARILVTIYVEKNSLPNANVILLRNDVWEEGLLHQIIPAGTIVGWPGPIPISAVHHFSMDSERSRSHLVGMVNSFEDLELPHQPILIHNTPITFPAPLNSSLPAPISLPPNWNALRGAASMAVATVPSIGPWLDSLCHSLNIYSDSHTGYSQVDPLLAPAPWSTKHIAANPRLGLWQAILETLATPEIADGWMPQKILEIVCTRARELSEEDDALDRLRDSTMLLLRDQGTIESLGIKDDFISLAFQLVLLRPTPERYMSWREDWRAVPPAAWWTGAILTGYMRGYKALPRGLKGNPILRKALAIRTWALWNPSSIGSWSTYFPDQLVWNRVGDSVIFSVSTDILSQQKMSTRGLWFELDLSNQANEKAACELASDLCPDTLINTLQLESGSFAIHGNTKIIQGATATQLIANGPVEIELNPSAKLSKRLNISEFRKWLSHASIHEKLPRPQSLSDRLNTDSLAISVSTESLAGQLFEIKAFEKKKVAKKKTTNTSIPNGLLIVQNFLKPSQEKDLVSAIDSTAWDVLLKRRVQHYGWRYDYKARGINLKNHLGQLPPWGLSLAQQLLNEGLVPELPDQIIVNEYLADQGISKHIDCKECFRGPIVTISLLETWEMVFARKSNETEEKYKVLLPRYSATVLSGEAREKWTHEISKKKADAGRNRYRRISITLRKVEI